ncbi:MAG: hypothetical protein QM773_13805 [Hyphomonadaceae bacterium]
MHCYAVPPIDFWLGWMDPQQFAKSASDHLYDLSQTAKTLQEAHDLLTRGEEFCKEHLGWEGDKREGPYFTVVPTGDPYGALVVAWKQDNNGTTFVVSEHPLPWLKDL